MASVTRSAIVPFSAQQMFDLINDVEAYPQFLPNCSQARIIQFDGKVMQASLTVKKGPISESFTTENTLHAPNRIDMKLVKGPFKSLSGQWIITQLSEHACKIELDLNFEFRSGLLSRAFSAIFAQLANDMVVSFQQRARQQLS